MNGPLRVVASAPATNAIQELGSRPWTESAGSSDGRSDSSLNPCARSSGSMTGGGSVRGPRPLLALVPTGGAPFPAGDVRLEIELSEGPTPVNATLFVNTGDGFTDAALRLPLPAPRAGFISAVVTLPPCTVGVGLQPGPVGEFRLGALRVVELSAVGAVVAHGGPQLARLLRNPAQLFVLLGRAVRLFWYRGPTGVVERLRRGTQRQLAEEGYESWARRYANADRRAASAPPRPARGASSCDRASRFFSRRSGLQQRSSSERSTACDGRFTRGGSSASPRMVRLPTSGNLPARSTALSHLRWAKGRDALRATQRGPGHSPRAGRPPCGASALHRGRSRCRAAEPRPFCTPTREAEDGGGRLSPAFKPDWSPELLHSLDYVGRSAFLAPHGCRPWEDGARDPGLPLTMPSCCATPPGYRRSTSPTFRSFSLRTRREQTPTVEEAEAAVRRRAGKSRCRHTSARVEPGRRPRTCRVRYAVSTPPPQVSVLVPTRDRVRLLRRCVESVQRTAYRPVEVLVVDNGSRERRTHAYFRQLEEEGAARVLAYPQPFNYSAMNNLAAREARGEVLCLLNNDVEAIDRGWLTEMVGLALQPGVGAVGAKLLYPNDTVQHAGTVAGLFGVAAHGYLREPREADGYMLQLQTTREVAAVTAACMVIRKDRFLEVGGLDETELPVAFNDVDLCFKLLKAGYRNLWTPYAELYHRESASRGTDERGGDRRRFLREEAVMRQRWGALIERDPYYNPNLSLDSNTPRPAWPPRAMWPWERAP